MLLGAQRGARTHRCVVAGQLWRHLATKSAARFLPETPIPLPTSLKRLDRGNSPRYHRPVENVNSSRKEETCSFVERYEDSVSKGIFSYWQKSRTMAKKSLDSRHCDGYESGFSDISTKYDPTTPARIRRPLVPSSTSSSLSNSSSGSTPSLLGQHKDQRGSTSQDDDPYFGSTLTPINTIKSPTSEESTPASVILRRAAEVMASPDGDSLTNGSFARDYDDSAERSPKIGNPSTLPASDMPASDKKVKIEQENTNHSLTDNLCEALRNGLNLDFSADSPAALRQFGASPFQQFNERNAGDSSPIHTDSFVSARQSLSSEEDVDVLQGDFERDSGFLEQNLVDKFNNCVNLNDNSTPTRRISSSTIPKAAPSLAQDRGMSPSPAKFTASPIQDGVMSPSPAKSTASSIQGRELSPSPAKSTTSFIQDRGMSPSPAKSTASSIQDRELSPSPAKPIFSKATNSAGGSALPLKGQGENQTPPQRAPPPTQKGLCTLSETDESDVEDDLQDSKSAGAGLKGTTTISDSSSSDNDETFTERTAALPPTSSARSIDLDQDDADDDFEDEQSDQDDEDYANDGESDEDSIYTPSPKKKATSTRIQAGNKKEEEESPLFAPVRSATQLRRRPRRNTAVAAAGASREMSQSASRVLHTNNEEDEDDQLESNDFLGKEHTRVPASTPLRLTPPTSPLSIGESTPLPPCEYTPPPKSYKATAAKELVYDLSSSPLAMSESTPLPCVESTPPPKSYKATAAKEFDEEFDENSPLPPPRKSTRKGPQKVVFLSSSDEDEDDDYFEEDDDDENDENELSKSNFSIQTSTPLMPKGKAPKRNIRSSRRVESSDEDDEDEESENEYDLEDSFIASDEDLSEEEDEDEDYVDEGSSDEDEDDEDEDDEDADADSDVEILSVASSSKSSSGVEFCENDHDDDFSDMSDAEKSIAKIKASKTSKERQNGTSVKDSIKVTKSNREKLARDLLAEFNDTVFGGEIPYDLKITWNARMTSSAGFCFMKCSSDRTRSARIELSSKVITNGERLNTTLLHELCHAAAWLVDGVQKPPHGPAFVKWAERATQVYPRYPVTTCHNYKVHAPFRYECTGCKATWTRHSKSIDVNSMCCSRCKSRSSLVFVGQFDENGNKIEKKKLNAYQQFVKDNYKTVLDEVNDKSKVMGILAERWKEFKAAQ